MDSGHCWGDNGAEEFMLVWKAARCFFAEGDPSAERYTAGPAGHPPRRVTSVAAKTLFRVLVAATVVNLTLVASQAAHRLSFIAVKAVFGAIRAGLALYHDLVFNLFLPNWSGFGPLVGLAEMTAGLLLLLGPATWVGALLAAPLSLHIQFSDANGPWLYEYAVEWVPLLCLVFMSAGVTWGLDGRIAKGHPRWRLVFAGTHPVGGRWRT